MTQSVSRNSPAEDKIHELSELDVEPSTYIDDMPDITDYDYALYSVIGEGFDYSAQIMAIDALLKKQKESDALLKAEMEKISAFISRTGSERAIDEWGEHFMASVYQDAAHSMSAVGVLAPVVESIFYQLFQGLRRKILQSNKVVVLRNHERWQRSSAAQWDCHFVWDKKGVRKDIVKGIIQLSEATGLSPHLPKDLMLTLQAVFEYRNKMFHHGFEWPVVERERFQRRIQTANWPKNWLSAATSGGSPWIFYWTDTFIKHCLCTIDSVLSGVGAFARQIG